MRAVSAFLLLLSATTFSYAEPMKFTTASAPTNGNPESWIGADGEITAETPHEFENFLEQNPSERILVVLNSPGGDLLAGLQLGALIRSHHLGTTVGKVIPEPDFPGAADLGNGKCASSCVYAFFGGEWRLANDDELGVHQYKFLRDANSYTLKDISYTQRIASVVTTYVASMGIDPRFLETASSAESDSILWLKHEIMVQYNIIEDKSDYRDWMLKPLESGIVAYSSSRNGDETAVMSCKGDKIVRMTLTFPNPLRVPTIDSDLQHSLQTTITSFADKPLEPGDFAPFEIKDGKMLIDFRIPEGANVEVFQYDVLGAVGPFTPISDHNFPKRDFSTYFRLVSRNCVD